MMIQKLETVILFILNANHIFVSFLIFWFRSQLGECLKTIIYADYPEQWPRLLDWVKYNLQNQQIYGALFVLRILSRKYE